MDYNTPFQTCRTIFLCDETKFYIKNGDAEDALFYFCIPVTKDKVKHINYEFNKILLKNRIQSKVFHSTSIFRGKRDRKNLIQDLTRLIIKNELLCICFKYPKERVFKTTKLLNYLNDSNIFDFNKAEFQALFYFLVLLNTDLVEHSNIYPPRPYLMFFDQNVYKDKEEFNFPNPNFVIKHMTFTEKGNISLLALPDFLGYIFRQSKKIFNKIEAGQQPDITNLHVYCQQALRAINDAGFFRLIHLQDHLLNLGKALNIDFNKAN